MNLRLETLFRPARRACAPALLVIAAVVSAAPASAQLSDAVVAGAVALVREAATTQAPPKARVVVQAGSLDARLRLAPCPRVQSYLAGGSPVWGRTRVGLRCIEGATRWNVYLPMTVQVLAPAVVATAALPSGARIEASNLDLAEADWAAATTAPWADTAALAGRVLARPVAAGQPLRPSDLQPRIWFAAGDTVQIHARGDGYSVAGEGQAMMPGHEGRQVRVRTTSGRIVVGRAVGERELEVDL